MRWFWFDRYTEFISGERATAIKCVTLAEDHLHDHFPSYPVMPNSLVVEGMAQVSGLMVGEAVEYTKRIVLAKLVKVVFHGVAIPGDMLTYRAKLEDMKEEGARVSTTSHIGDRPHAEAEIFFAKLDSDSIGGRDLFPPGKFLQWLKLVGMYEVGRKSDGSKLHMPPGLAKYDTADAYSL